MTDSARPLPVLTLPPQPSRGRLLLGWLLAGVVLLAVPGARPMTRTQEARVLETAREMLGAGPREWLVPRVNGHVRLRKPPLAYWVAAASFKVLGISEAAGRVPFALAGWLTLGVTYHAGAWLFGRRAGLLAAAVLLAFVLFFRHSRLAETDALVVLFITAATYATWRGAVAGEGPRAESEAPAGASGFGAAALWFNLGAVAMALAALAKGPPALYPLGFLLARAAVERRWKGAGGWVLSGAPFTLALLALPWFVYAALQPDFAQILDDLDNSALGGKGHHDWFFQYIPQLLSGTLPWVAFVVVALAEAVRAWRVEPAVRGLLLWIGSIFVPLCFWGNKQPHYLLPLLPPLAILVGWLVCVRLPAEITRLRPLLRFVHLATLGGCAVAGVAVVVVGWKTRGRAGAPDFALAAVAVGAVAVASAAYRRRGVEASVPTLAALAPVVVAAAMAWSPTLPHDPTPREIAARVRAECGPGPYCFVKGEDLPLCFALRSVIPVAADSGALAEMLRDHPGLVVIRTHHRHALAPEALGLVERLRFRDGKDFVTVYAR